MTHLIGMDLGQAQDFTTRAVIRRREVIRAKPVAEGSLDKEAWIYPYYHCRWIERPPQHTPYPEIVAGTKTLIEHPEIGGPDREGDYTLVVDITRERAVFDYMIQSGLAPVGVIKTGGHEAREQKDEYGQATGIWTVPKEDIVQTFQIVLQNGRFTAEPNLPHAAQLRKEMQAYQMKTSRRAHTSYEAMREEDHDDILTAIMDAIWYAETVAGIQQLEVRGEGYNYAEDYDPLGRGR